MSMIVWRISSSLSISYNVRSRSCSSLHDCIPKVGGSRQTSMAISKTEFHCSSRERRTCGSHPIFVRISKQEMKIQVEERRGDYRRRRRKVRGLRYSGPSKIKFSKNPKICLGLFIAPEGRPHLLLVKFYFSTWRPERRACILLRFLRCT